MNRHLLLVGLPGSGKSSVARRLAGQMGTAYSDVDALIEAQVGLSIAEIFATRGEAAFRELEQDLVNRLLAREPHVIAPGGGWIVAAPAPDVLAERALVIYLRVTPEVALKRLEGAVPRPLLQLDPVATMDRLLAERGPLYGLAALVVDTDFRDIEAVADEILDLARNTA